MVGFFRLGKLGSEKDVAAEPQAEIPAAASGAGGFAAHDEKPERKKRGGNEGRNGAASGPAADALPASGGGLSVNDFIGRTKFQQRQGLKPSGPELIAYSRYLGIDPVADHDLLWIAVEALEAPLPASWTEHFDSSDRVFYYNATTRVSAWTHPLEQIYRDAYKQTVQFRNGNWSQQERAERLQTLQGEVKQMEVDVHREIAQWTEHTDEQGNRFYFNREERQSLWMDPRPAKCQVLYLRMKVLTVLQSSCPGASSGAAARTQQATGRPADARPAPSSAVSGLRDDKGDAPACTSNRPAGDDDSSQGSADGDSDDDRARRKKKKKKKKKKKRHGSDDEGRGEPVSKLTGGGAIHGAQPLGLEPLDGLQSRPKVKAGIRLEPLAPVSTQAPVAGAEVVDLAGDRGPKAVAPWLQLH